MGFINNINHFANSINPFKGPTDWLTHNTLSKLPVVGKPLGQLADWGDSHPAQVGAAIGAAFGGAALLGGAGAGGAAGGVAGGAEGGAGGGLAAGGGLGTASGFGGAGVDAGATGFGSWGTAAGGADVGGLTAADSAAVSAEGASPGLMESYGPASSSSFDWQGLARRALSNQLKSQGNSSSGGQYQPIAQQSYPDQGGQQQRMAMALMQPYSGAPYLPASQLSNSALAAYLMPKANGQQLYQPAGNNPSSRNANGNTDAAPGWNY